MKPSKRWKRSKFKGATQRPCLRCGKVTQTTVEYRLCKSCRELADGYSSSVSNDYGISTGRRVTYTVD